MEKIRCPYCNQRIFDVKDQEKMETIIVIKCSRCRNLVMFPSEYSKPKSSYIEQRK